MVVEISLFTIFLNLVEKISFMNQIVKANEVRMTHFLHELYLSDSKVTSLAADGSVICTLFETK